MTFAAATPPGPTCTGAAPVLFRLQHRAEFHDRATGRNRAVTGTAATSLSAEDNNSSQVGRSATFLRCGGVGKFPVNAKPRFSKPADTDSNYQAPQPIPTFRPSEK
jgi:hypothetical protein